MAWYHRLLNVARDDRHSTEIEREVASHLAERTDDLIASGMDRSDAAHEARRRFGNPTVQVERSRDVDGMPWLEAIVADTRYAFRALRMSPGFTLVAVLSLALGIGANTAIFSLTNALALKALPVRSPRELVAITMGASGGDVFTNPIWEQIRDHSAITAGAFAFGGDDFNLANGGEVRRARANWVSGDFFSVLGVRAAAGRLLQHGDDVRGCGSIVAVSSGFAQRTFGNVPAAVGKTVSLDGHPFQVVGVVDPAFHGVEVGRPPDIYAPLCAQVVTTGRPDILDARSRWYLNVMARLPPGTTPDQLASRLALLAPGVFAATLPANYPRADQQEYLKLSLGAKAAPAGLSDLRDSYGKALVILMVLVGVVLLIACANIANLLLARVATRQREMAIRLALGAGRGRLIRQLLTESLLLSFAGATVGVLFSRWASALLVGFISTGSQAVWLDLSLDRRALLFTIAVATLTGVLFGLAPAWRATQVDPQATMKAGGRGIAGSRSHRLGRSLVVGQVALSLVLVSAGGLLLGSFHRLVTLDPGFRRDGVLLAQVNLGATGLKDRDLVTVPMEMLRRVRELPGVAMASASLITPISGTSWNDNIRVTGAPTLRRADSLAFFNQVSEGYFATLGTRLVAGRDISADDITGQRSVAVINEAMARRFFGSTSPIGRNFRTPNRDSVSPPREIVGVVANAKYQHLDEVFPPTVYFPIGVGDQLSDVFAVEIRMTGSVAEIVQRVKAMAASVNPAISLEFTTLEAQVSESIARPRLLAALSGFFGGLALLLAMIGLYGTMSYNVTQRRNEIGIRMALGAGNPRVLRMVAGEAGRLIAGGILLGVLLALATTRLVAAFLYGVAPTDVTTLGVSALALALIGMTAAFVPAVRAARLDPMAALRED